MDPFGVTGPVALAQLLLQYFTGAALGERFKELDRLRDLETGQNGAAIINELFFGHRLPLLEYDERFRNLAPAVIGHGNDRALQDQRVRIDGLLDLDRRNILAARDDDVLLAFYAHEVAFSS